MKRARAMYALLALTVVAQARAQTTRTVRLELTSARAESGELARIRSELTLATMDVLLLPDSSRGPLRHGLFDAWLQIGDLDGAASVAAAEPPDSPIARRLVCSAVDAGRRDLALRTLARAPENDARTWARARLAVQWVTRAPPRDRASRWNTSAADIAALPLARARVDALMALADVAMTTSDTGAAVALARRAVTDVREAGDADYVSVRSDALARLFLTAGRVREAEAQLARVTMAEDRIFLLAELAGDPRVASAVAREHLREAVRVAVHSSDARAREVRMLTLAEMPAAGRFPGVVTVVTATAGFPRALPAIGAEHVTTSDSTRAEPALSAEEQRIATAATLAEQYAQAGDSSAARATLRPELPALGRLSAPVARQVVRALVWSGANAELARAIEGLPGEKRVELRVATANAMAELAGRTARYTDAADGCLELF